MKERKIKAGEKRGVGGQDEEENERKQDLFGLNQKRSRIKLALQEI